MPHSHAGEHTGSALPVCFGNHKIVIFLWNVVSSSRMIAVAVLGFVAVIFLFVCLFVFVVVFLLLLVVVFFFLSAVYFNTTALFQVGFTT